MRFWETMFGSIERKMVAITVCVLFIALGILGYCNFYYAKGMAVSDAKQSLTLQTDGYSQRVGQWFEMRRREVDILATNPAIINGQIDQAVPYLAAETKRNPVFTRLWIVNAQGQAVHSTGDHTNIADRDYFKEVMSTGKTIVTDPIISKVDGTMVVSVVAPIKRDNVVVGVLGGTVGVDNLAQTISKIKVGENGYAYVLGSDGTILIHPDKSLILKKNMAKQTEEPELAAISQKMVQGETGLGSYQYQGQKKIVAYAPIPGLKWSLGINVPAGELFSKVTPLIRVSLLSMLVILVLACGVSCVIARRFAKPIVELNQVIEQVAQGDLRLQATGNHAGKATQQAGGDELQQMIGHFYGMVRDLQALVKNIVQSAGQVAASSEELTASTDQSSQAVTQVAESIEHVASGMADQVKNVDHVTQAVSHMSASMQQVAAHAADVSDTAIAASDAARKGSENVAAATDQMKSIEEAVTHSAQVVATLGDQSQKIGQIVDTIDGIAGQTNLLALNAAIEAARAGEQGRGFAVVAEEVRRLAEQSREATQQIAVIIGQIQNETEKAVSAMDTGTEEVKRGTIVVNAAGVSFQEIVGLIEKVSKQIQSISAAIEQTASGSEKVVAATKQIDEISKKTAAKNQSISAATEEQSASVEEIAAASQALAAMAEELRGSVEHFKV